MKSFLTATALFFAVIVLWGFYNNYSGNILYGFVAEVEDNIIVAVTDEDWERAEADFETLSKQWSSYKKRAVFFFSTADINEVDYAIAKAKYFIKAEDISNASGELAYLKELLAYLHYNESFRLENIF